MLLRVFGHNAAARIEAAHTLRGITCMLPHRQGRFRNPGFSGTTRWSKRRSALRRHRIPRFLVHNPGLGHEGNVTDRPSFWPISAAAVNALAQRVMQTQRQLACVLPSGHPTTLPAKSRERGAGDENLVGGLAFFKSDWPLFDGDCGIAPLFQQHVASVTPGSTLAPTG